MKTTIKTADGESLTIQPQKITKCITLNTSDKHGNFVSLTLEPDQLGIMLFAIENECEAMGLEL